MYETLGLGSQSYRIFSVHPDLQMACDAAINFVGRKFPGEKESLLNEMLKDAFAAYRQAEKEEVNARHAFIRGLCQRAIYLYMIRYCNRDLDSNVVWVPMMLEITKFEELYPDLIVLNEPDPQYVNKSTALSLFAARILPSHLYSEVFETEMHYAKAS